MSRRTVGEVLAGRRARIREDVSGRLLAVRRESLAPAPYALVDAGPTRRRLACRLHLGYPAGWIASQLGPGSARPRLQVGERRVRARTERAVRELFERIGGRPPAAGRQS